MIKNCSDEAMEVDDDPCCRICLVFEPDPRDNEALMHLDIAEEVPNDVLVPLGCGCREELSLVHYACALKWFNIKGLRSSCEVCGVSPSGISMAHRLKARRFQFRNWLSKLAVADDDMVARIVTFYFVVFMMSNDCSMFSISGIWTPNDGELGL
jgi:hypothetical protein